VAKSSSQQGEENPAVIVISSGYSYSHEVKRLEEINIFRKEAFVRGPNDGIKHFGTYPQIFL
jgi:hypothetical protein